MHNAYHRIGEKPATQKPLQQKSATKKNLRFACLSARSAKANFIFFYRLRHLCIRLLALCIWAPLINNSKVYFFIIQYYMKMRLKLHLQFALTFFTGLGSRLLASSGMYLSAVAISFFELVLKLMFFSN